MGGGINSKEFFDAVEAFFSPADKSAARTTRKKKRLAAKKRKNRRAFVRLAHCRGCFICLQSCGLLCVYFFSAFLPLIPLPLIFFEYLLLYSHQNVVVWRCGGVHAPDL
jgi:hypothetical protein